LFSLFSGHFREFEGAFETINPVTPSTAFQPDNANGVTEKIDRPQFPIDLRQCRTIRAGP